MIKNARVELEESCNPKIFISFISLNFELKKEKCKYQMRLSGMEIKNFHMACWLR